MSDPALCPAQLSSGIRNRGGRRHCSSSVSLSLLDPWSRVARLRQPVHVDPLVGRSQSCRTDRIALQQAFNPPPACFAVSLLPSITSPRVPAPRTTFTETPLFEVCSAKVRSRHFVLHQHVSRGPGASSLRVSPFRHECQMHCHCHPETMERLVFQVFCPRPISPTQGFF